MYLLFEKVYGQQTTDHGPLPDFAGTPFTETNS